MISCTRKIGWDMGHRVLNHEGKCARLHGHRYTAHITTEALALDSIGRVIDFGAVKTHLGVFVEETWDHRTMLHRDDPLREAIPEEHVVIVDSNPTAENIAAMLFAQAVAMLEHNGLSVKNVRVYETPNCYADFAR